MTNVQRGEVVGVRWMVACGLRIGRKEWSDGWMNVDPPPLSDAQRKWQFIFVGLLIATGVSWILVCVVIGPSLSPDWFGSLFFALLNFQCAMLGFWAGLGKRPWHVAAAVAGAPTLAIIANISVGGGELPEFMVYCFAIMAVVGVTSGGLRLWKGSLERVVAGDSERDALQFGIKHIIIWTAVIAVLLGFGRLAVQTLALVDLRGLMTLIFGLATCVAISTVVNIWALLGFRVTMLKLLMLTMIGLCMSAASYVLMRHEMFFAMATMLSQLFTGVAIYALRMHGMRFVKQADTADD